MKRIGITAILTILMLAMVLAFAPAALAQGVCTPMAAAARVVSEESGEAVAVAGLLAASFREELEHEFRMQDSRFKISAPSSDAGAGFVRGGAAGMTGAPNLSGTTALTISDAVMLTGGATQPRSATTIASPRTLTSPRTTPRTTQSTKSKAESLGATGMLRFPGHNDTADAMADWRIVNSAYFAAVNVPFVKGRNFVPQDTEKAPRVAIVDEYLAQKLWPNQDAVGRRFRLDGDDTPWMTVVGVVRHQSGGALESSTHGQLYFPYPETSSATDSSNFD